MWTETFFINAAIDVLLFFYVIDCIFMGLVIMMQRSKQEGLGAAFGSGMMSDTFGAQTSNVLVKATVVSAIIFFVLSISLARLYSVRTTFLDKGSPVQQELLKPVAPVKPPPPAAPTATSPSATPAAPASIAPTTPAAQPAAPSQPAGK
ncbi:MAG TPA: preprotein translocase subunit SecG [Candidatus Methylacidiphilales bacterium]|jgi:preprotein translocase subunit SecG|nr:preprotein translocase subunit SecG [Candidatus Methylacidiphilales bacterium]